MDENEHNVVWECILKHSDDIKIEDNVERRVSHCFIRIVKLTDDFRSTMMDICRCKSRFLPS